MNYTITLITLITHDNPDNSLMNIYIHSYDNPRCHSEVGTGVTLPSRVNCSNSPNSHNSPNSPNPTASTAVGSEGSIANIVGSENSQDGRFKYYIPDVKQVELMFKASPISMIQHVTCPVLLLLGELMFNQSYQSY